MDGSPINGGNPQIRNLDTPKQDCVTKLGITNPKFKIEASKEGITKTFIVFSKKKESNKKKRKKFHETLSGGFVIKAV